NASLDSIKPTGKTKIIIAAFTDSVKNDLMEYYTGTLKNDVMEQGGRGAQINGFLAIDLSKTEFNSIDLSYSTGQYDTGNGNSIIQGLPFRFSGVKGLNKETEPYNYINGNTFYGSDGGNIIKNTFDFYEEHKPEYGNTELIYVGPGDNYICPLNIISGNDIELAPIQTNTHSIVAGIINHVCVLRRT
ncbi:MAG: hypothetical protein LBP43_07650, partial [Treponema sp.]|nr:hypothetical protein [Treponema sp.]